eukprot:1149064-Pelagomonas_calceolata.AAC.9
MLNALARNFLAALLVWMRTDMHTRTRTHTCTHAHTYTHTHTHARTLRKIGPAAEPVWEGKGAQEESRGFPGAASAAATAARFEAANDALEVFHWQ